MYCVLKHDTEKPRNTQSFLFDFEEEALKFAIDENYETWLVKGWYKYPQQVNEKLPSAIRDVFVGWYSQRRGPEKLPLGELTVEELHEVNMFVEDLVCLACSYCEFQIGFY